MKLPFFRALSIVLVLAQLGAARNVGASELVVRVLDQGGAPLAGVAVVLEVPGAGRPAALREPRTAVMDQRDERFVPDLLVVQTGTTVTFPNNDHVMHHVYSFSEAKTFEIPLYQHPLPAPAVRFDRPGLVVLGCNIHDRMIGHILVVDSPYFGVTDPAGVVRLDTGAEPAGELMVWHPGLGGRDHAVRRPVDGAEIVVRVSSSHVVSSDESEGALSWGDY